MRLLAHPTEFRCPSRRAKAQAQRVPDRSTQRSQIKLLRHYFDQTGHRLGRLIVGQYEYRCLASISLSRTIID